jgi:hypothetical protein
MRCCQTLIYNVVGFSVMSGRRAVVGVTLGCDVRHMANRGTADCRRTTLNTAGMNAEKRHFHWPVSAIHILKLEK